MRNPVKERVSLITKHDFDSLPSDSEIEVRPARHSELSIVADMGRRLVPGVQISERMLGEYLTFDSECILTFGRHEKLLGAMAFLYLNSRGHDALMLGEISLAQPDIGLLAGRNDGVSAIYIWAIATTGRGIAGYDSVPELYRCVIAGVSVDASPGIRGVGGNGVVREIQSGDPYLDASA